MLRIRKLNFSYGDLQSHEVVEAGVIQVPEGRRIFPEMTVVENLRMGSFVKATRKDRERNMDRVFSLFPRLAERRTQLGGLVTEKMLFGYMPAKASSLDQWELHYLMSKTPVRAAMNPKPHTVTPETPIAEAAKLIHDRKLNGIIVVNEKGDLLGLLTTTNALEALIWFTQLAAK